VWAEILARDAADLMKPVLIEVKWVLLSGLR
jgi:hypothetical protein